MSDLPPIAITLTADTSKLNSGLKHAAGQVGGFADDTGKRMHGMGIKSGLAMAAVGGGALVAGAAVLHFAKASVQAAQDSVVSDARLDQVAKTMGLVDGAYAGGTKRLKDYASQLSTQIGVEDESIKAVQAKLLTFKSLGSTMNETGGAMDRATAAAYDLASAGFGSAEGNATALGKALQDPVKGITALSRSGVTFTQTEKDKIKALAESNQMGKAQEMVLKAIETQTKGTAAATATASQKMKVSFGELQEKVGMAFLPVLAKLADTLIPIFDKLQGPLGKVAEALGGALAKALDALAPVLPVLAEAFAKIAGTVGGILATAITALIPIVTPLLNLFGQLATRIGPMITPLLEKIGTLFNAVMIALIPLVEPLTTVVMDILDAAAPILGVVVDALIILVNALAPVLAAVGQLIKPLGQLINVVLVALMPVIQPLLPVITALAAVLGDVLVRAVGLIMTALGYMIQGWAKLAPFILENVTKPVVGFFLQMASDIIDSAQAMFSWVPGLGDKLATAKSAIDGFKETSTKAISDAAASISVEGTKIGKGLVDNGVAMMTDPASVNKVKVAASGIGLDLALGIAAGISSGQTHINAASKSSIERAEQAARSAAESASPSKLFARIGGDLTAGLVEGVKAGGDDVRKTLQATYGDWFSSTVDMLKGKLTEAKDAFNSFKTDVAAAITGGIDFSAAAPKFDEDGKRIGGTFIEALTAQAEQAKNFAAKVKELVSMGLSREALTQVLQAGMEAGTNIANELISGGSTAISTTNDLVSSTQKAADDVGLLAATNFLGAGVVSATETVNGFKQEFGKDGKGYKRMMNIMDRLAEDSARTARIDVEVTRHITEVVTTIPGAASTTPSTAEHRALGGMVVANNPYIVGERGPELFVPNGISGSIVPNEKLKSENNIVVYAQTNADAHDISREIAWALKVGV